MPDGGVRHGPFRYNPSILPIIMPATRASARAQATLPARALRVVRFLTVLLVAGFAAFCVLLLLLRHVVMPQIPAHRAEIAELLSRRIGAPIEIDAIATGWDGWNPKLVIDGFRVRASADAPSVLDLPHVELVAAWTSLPLLQLRLKHLAIERPALAVRRDADGQLHIAGMDVDTGDTGGESPFVTWLLRQREIAVHNAVITWTDDARGAPALAIEHVELRMQNEFGRHRFAATGIPPSSLASPIDVRGELSRASLLDWLLRTRPEIDVLTYLDSDLYFFSDPTPIFEAFQGYSTLIIEHRFPPQRVQMEAYGRYNVGWLTFRRDAQGLACVAWWRDRCLEWCYDRLEDGRFADQGYLDQFPKLFRDVLVLDHPGANLAPWNAGTHQLAEKDGHILVDGQSLIFFHFQNFRQMAPLIWRVDHRDNFVPPYRFLGRLLYRPYIRALARAHILGLGTGLAPEPLLSRPASGRGARR